MGRIGFSRPSFPIVHRNLALAYADKGDEASIQRAIFSLEKAVTLPNPYPLHFAELDRLYEIAGTSPEKRLALLEQNRDVVLRRDDATARLIGLLLCLGREEEAIQLMSSRGFDIWEEGDRFDFGAAWADAHLRRGKRRLAAGNPDEARADFQTALYPPANLRVPENEGFSPRQVEVSYWVGETWAAADELEKARKTWEHAAAISFPFKKEEGIFSEEHGVQMYYRALILARLGRKKQAATLFQELESAGEVMVKKSLREMKSSASVRERSSRLMQMASGHYLVALSLLGRGEKGPAKERLRRALEARPDHRAARLLFEELPYLLKPT